MTVNRSKLTIPHEWTFETADVAKGFDHHVREQLPWYDMATGAIAHIARHYVRTGGVVYDIGASTGNIGRALAETLRERKATLIAVEKSRAMCDAYDAPGRIECADATEYRYGPHCLAVAFLTMQFIPPAKRARIVLDLVDATEEGGAVIIFDKTDVHASYYVGTIMRRLTLAGKAAAGVPPGEIVAKELSLGGVQRPIEIGVIERVAPRAFMWFRFGEFASWLIEK